MAVEIVTEFITSAICVVLGMLYPGYMSFKAVKKADVPGQQKWLHYWLVLSLLSALSLVLEPLVSSRVPMFSLLKIALVGFLVHPKTRGFEKIYDAVVEPQLNQHMATIDRNLEQLDKASQDAMSNVVPTVSKYGQQAKDIVTRSMSKKAS